MKATKTYATTKGTKETKKDRTRRNCFPFVFFVTFVVKTVFVSFVVRSAV